MRIAKGIPIPERNPTYPLLTMQVGDSFTFPLEKRKSIQTLASRYKKHGKVYTVKAINDKQCRIWRVK